MRRCPRCNGAISKGSLCASCQAYIFQRWPSGLVPLEQSEPWMAKRAEHNVRSAAAGLDRLIGQCQAHVELHAGNVCTELWCVGGQVTRTLDQLRPSALRILALVAIRTLAVERRRD